MKVAQLCPTLCDPMDCIVHGILQARILEWVAFRFSRGSSQPRDRTQVSRIAGRFSTSEPQGKPKKLANYWKGTLILRSTFSLSQWSPTIWEPGTDFVEDNYSLDQDGGGDGFRMSQGHYIYYALYF